MGTLELCVILVLIQSDCSNTVASSWVKIKRVVGVDDLGTDAHTKTDEFSEKFQRGGGGSFSIQKFMLQILDFK